MKKILIAFITTILLVGCSSKPVVQQSTEVKKTEESKQQEGLKQQAIEIADKVSGNFEFSNILYGNNGVCTVNGNIKNLDSRKHSAIIKIVFYDKDNKILETATGAIVDIEANQTKAFLANGTKEVKGAVKVNVEVNKVE